jgi:hypothetical protein
MSTKREQIMLALKAKLDSMSPAPAGGVSRTRVYAFDRASLPAVTIEPISDDPSEGPIPYVDWDLLVRIAVVVRGNAPDSLADPIAEQVHAAVMSDQTLGGLAMDVEPASAKFEFHPGDLPTAIVSLGFRISYRTLNTDLSQ